MKTRGDYRRWLPMIPLLALLPLAACGHAQLPAAAPAAALESFIFSAEDGATTRFWLADPAKPSVRRLLLVVEHQSGWAGVADVSPDGRTVAFTMLPRDERDPDHGARLQLLDVRSRQSRTVADGIDLRSTLVWAPDGGVVTYQRFDGQQQQVWAQPASGEVGTQLSTAGAGERIFPLSLNGPSGQLLEVRLSEHGVDLQRTRQGALPEQLQHLSDGTARGFALSPGGERFAYLATDQAEATPLSRAFLLDLKASSVQALPDGWGEMVGVAWEPNGVLVAGSAGTGAQLRTEAGDRLPSPTTRGFFQPLRWSPSGHYLAVRVFSGDTAAQPGSARDALLTQRGKLVSIADTLPVRFVGWVPAGAPGASK
ncbi:MAG TPA: hypothetical protein VK821_21220 [Dehalococcoidia bacterium]|nr:hypothetical protein [Dehalococcoidia bacterium]